MSKQNQKLTGAKDRIFSYFVTSSSFFVISLVYKNAKYNSLTGRAVSQKLNITENAVQRDRFLT